MDPKVGWGAEAEATATIECVEPVLIWLRAFRRRIGVRVSAQHAAKPVRDSLESNDSKADASASGRQRFDPLKRVRPVAEVHAEGHAAEASPFNESRTAFRRWADAFLGLRQPCFSCRVPWLCGGVGHRSGHWLFGPALVQANDGTERDSLRLHELALDRVQFIDLERNGRQWPGGPWAPNEQSAPQLDAPW